MLALKECLIREGVLNLDSPEKYRPYHLHGSRSSGTMDIPRYRKTIAASSDLSTAPATAKTSCQPPEPQKSQQKTTTKDSSDSSSQKSSSGYRGHHPHFHHHTTPAYYTDLQLRIHTPNASDVGALNENYRSVYSTPSTQLVEQRSFPKSSSATKDPPLSSISNPARSTFFRGDSASSDSHTRLQRRSQQRYGSEPGRFNRYSQGSASPTKGELESGQEPVLSSHHSPINTSTNSTSNTTTISSCNPVEPEPSSLANPSGATSGRNSRHKQRFHSSRSRRAVRVRSESRPISALYDIICKEKNLDNSSSSSSNEEREKDLEKRSPQKTSTDQEKSPTTDKLATFWPLHHHYLNPPMSSGNSGGPSKKQQQQQEKPGHHLLQGASKDLPAGSSNSSSDDERALHSSRKVTNLKATSLPPEEGLPSEISLSCSSSNRLNLRLARSLEPSARNIQATASREVQNYDAGEPVNTDRLFVEPPKVSLSAIRNTLYDHDDLEIEDCDSTTQFDQGDVLDTLERWNQEVGNSGSGAQLMNGGANGHHHHQSDPEADHHDHEQPDHLEQNAHQSLPVEPKSLHHHHHHQATNARRFITRTTRSASRQSSAGHSPPPPLHRSDDSSSSSPTHSPATRRRNKLGGGANDPPSSSANGNSSAYETAATTVMTHDHHHQQQQPRHPPVEVPKALVAIDPQPEAAISVLGSCPTAAVNSDEVATSTRRRRRRELGMARPLVPGDDEALRDLLQTPQKSSCSESTNSISEPYRQFIPAVRHPEVPVRTMTAVLPAPRPLHAPVARSVTQKFNERTKTELAEIKKIAEQSEPQPPAVDESQKMAAIARRKSTDEGGGLPNQNSPPAPNQIVSILKKKEHGLGDCNSSASSNPSPVTFSSSVMDNPLAGASRCKRQGILKKRSSLDESRYYSRSHSPDERSILIKSARRNSLEEAGTGLSPAQAHGILKQSSYDSSKSDGCPSANESQPHSILKKKDSLSTPSDGGCHKHVSISQAVTLAAAELAAHDGVTFGEDGEEHDIRPILKQESTSSEEAVRPPKPILKKKSFGEADEHEIRPILKSSRKSSREEFDLSGLESNEVNDSLSSILKSDSPSKRRSLGSASHDLEETSTSPSLLKRRTRSLERRDVQPGMDLAAALDAIANSQVAPSTPVDFVTTPSSISVAERIKRMEMLSTPTSRAAGGANSSWESPLQASTSEQAGGGAAATPRVLKPSVLRRDLQRERYKTQPVTNEEMSFFKANSAPFDISASSAFKPTKPLDIRLSHAPLAPLISPITGQPLSHVPAPLLLSSSTNSGVGSSFRLGRSSTQPLQSPRVVHLASQAAPGGSSASSSLLARQNSINDTSSVNLSEQLTLSIGTDSEHIFEMSALEEDSAIQSLSDETAASASASSSSAATATTTTTTTTPPSSGLTRSNSVRARANMFQQLQEQSRNQRATGANRQSPPAAAEVSSNQTDNSMQSEELSTPNATIDAEFEPSSLSLAERLAFFSNLCESGGGGGGGGSASGRYRSRTSSYSRSPPIERTTPRSSTTASSTSVTPTPMDYSPIPHEKELSSLTLESIIEPEEQEEQVTKDQVDLDEQVKLRKKDTPPPVLRESPLHNGFHVLTRSATDPPSSQSSLRITVRTPGKLILPDTFRGDRNNNSGSGSNSWNSCLVKLQTLEPVNLSVQLRTIGKVKSPFIEKQQEKQLANGTTSDSGSDSGKENCASNQQINHQESNQNPQEEENRAPPRVSEMRRKISRLVQQQQVQPQPVNRRHTTEITSVTIGAPRSPNVDDRFAKYFGVKESFNSTTTLMKTQSLPSQQVEATNAHVRIPPITTVVSKRRELLKRTRPLSMDHYSSGCTSPTAMPSPKRAHSPVNRRKATISSYEDIEVTPDELRAAGKEFKLLYGELLG
nr:serine-rich adhesin for platelets isoform X3 [Drosophila takahashii]